MKQNSETSEAVDMIAPLFPHKEPVPHKVFVARKRDRSAESGSEKERCIRLQDAIYTESRRTGEKAADIARRYFAPAPERLSA